MNAFQTIIQKYYGQEHIFLLTTENKFEFLQYVYNRGYNNKTRASFFIYLYILHLFVESPSEFISKKFGELNKYVTNIFMSETLKDEILNDFSKIQRIYYGFAKLAHIYKFKKAKVQVSSDLCMNELNPKKSNVFTLLQNKSKYYFAAKDLINMIKNNLSNCVGCVPEIIVLKNPYNNIPLNRTDLINIYFFMRWNSCVIPELFHGFFLCDFDLKKFRDDYETTILNTHIKNYIYTSHHDTLYPLFNDMWDQYRHITRRVIINEDFPKDKLINIMKPYLHLYYISLYATNGTYKQCSADYILRRKLIRFRNFNPRFGRRYVRIKKDIRKGRVKVVTFDFKHVNFYQPDNMGSLMQRNNYVMHEYYYDSNELRTILNALTDRINRETGQTNREPSVSISITSNAAVNETPTYYEEPNDFSENSSDGETTSDVDSNYDYDEQNTNTNIQAEEEKDTDSIS
jgi:hypothetical protein